MDNAILINQAHRLYAELLAKDVKPSVEKNIGLEQLDRAIIRAYCRYKRRLDRSVTYYQKPDHDCIRETRKKRPSNATLKPSKISKLSKFKYALGS